MLAPRLSPDMPHASAFLRAAAPITRASSGVMDLQRTAQLLEQNNNNINAAIAPGLYCIALHCCKSQQLGRGVDKRCWHLQDVSHTPALAGREPQAALPVQRRGQHVIGRQAILESQGLGRLRRQAVQQGARLAGGSEGRTNRSLAAPATLREQATPALVSGGASSNDRHNRCTVRGSPAAPVPPHAW